MANPFEAQSAGLPQQFVQMTLQSEQVCHYIRDDELERLGEMRKEPVMEICLAAIGVFFGSVVPALDGLSRFNATKDPMTGTDMITVCLLFMSLSVMIVTGILWYIRQGGHKSLVQEIRERPKVPVRLAHDNVA